MILLFRIPQQVRDNSTQVRVINMPWIEIHMSCSAEQAEQLSEQLTELGALAVTFRDAGDKPIYEPLPNQATTLWQETTAIALFDVTQPLKEILSYLENQQAEGNIKNFHLQSLPDQDWIRINLDSFKPILMGKRLCICPSWIPTPYPEKINIILDPGLAFGTGTHPTTALCLEWLDQNITSESLAIDYGCGSGILGIAALKLGAKKVIAIDYDEQALIATRSNAEINQITQSQLETYLPEQSPTIKADLIIANILAQPLIELAPVFAELLKPNGRIILSGILNDQINDLSNAYQALFKIQDVTLKNEWACIFAKK